MTTLEMMLAEAPLRAIGWALVHSLWQGALVALVYACFASLAKSSAANVRYVAACAALVLMLALPVATACLNLRGVQAPSARGASLAGDAWAESLQARGRAEADGKTAAEGATRGASDEAAATGGGFRLWAEERFDALLPWLVWGWAVGVALCALRVGVGWFSVRRLKSSARPVHGEYREVLACLARRLKVTRAARLCQSALVEVPTVVGHLRPLILIPASVFTGLSPEQLEAVLAHELAHVRRYDYLANLLQTVVETLLFYHPAAWWVAGRVRAEREHACDDAAVGATGDVLLYARSLAQMEQLRRERGETPALALAANGGSLMRRIRRLIQVRTDTHTRTPLVAGALLFVMLCGALAGARALLPLGGEGAAGVMAAAGGSIPAADTRREVAVTFVSFPGNGIYDNGRLANKTRKLMRSLATNDVKAVAFVNEARLYKEDGTPDEARTALLGEWLDAGHELGNETFKHTNLYRVSLAEFQTAVLKGEQIMSKLVRDRGGKLRYFSYPYLNTGSTLAEKTAAEKFLRERGYQIHPVTIDNMDWLFSQAYIEALRREDEQAATRIRAEYVPYMERMFEFVEGYSREVVGREFPQVLMLTAGALNADCFDDLARMIRRRGYSFVTMEQATRDEAYRLPDNYTGQRGDSWIARWAVTKGMEYKDSEENLPPLMQDYFTEFQKKQQANKAGSGDGKK
ncbi:MAG: polysaccharide deacetylase family protein [Acidobacteria bacterium]|nr:polysaccharide deacetylase family protein [Acidobacteriota bacterium]